MSRSIVSGTANQNSRSFGKIRQQVGNIIMLDPHPVRLQVFYLLSIVKLFMHYTEDLPKYCTLGTRVLCLFGGCHQVVVK